MWFKEDRNGVKSNFFSKHTGHVVYISEIQNRIRCLLFTEKLLLQVAYDTKKLATVGAIIK